MLFNPSTGLKSRRPINGRGLARRHLSGDQLASMAADVVSGDVEYRPSIEQVCRAFSIPTPPVRKHLKARREVGRPTPPNGRAVAKLLRDWKAADHMELVAFARAIGPGVIL